MKINNIVLLAYLVWLAVLSGLTFYNLAWIPAQDESRYVIVSAQEKVFSSNNNLIRQEIKGSMEGVIASVPTEARMQLEKSLIILMADLGLNNIINANALALPTNVTLGFSAYTLDKSILQNAKDQGFEVLLNIPSAENGIGPLHLSQHKTIEENTRVFNFILKNFDTYVSGIYFAPSDKINPKMVEVVLNAAHDRKFFIIDGGTNYSLLVPAAKRLNTKILKLDVAIDSEDDLNDIKAKFNSIDNLFQNKNQVTLGIFDPSPLVINFLKEWLQMQKGYVITGGRK